MRGYGGIERSLSACLHFVRNSEVDESLSETAQYLKDHNIVCAYVDYEVVRKLGQRIADCVGNSLHLEHSPYGPAPWVPFLDDLISLSDEVNGVVIVIDNANLFFSSSRNEVFDLIESFLIQFHHWLEKKKPCHLCFQLEGNPLIRQVFEPISRKMTL
jgi:hypothetical protein